MCNTVLILFNLKILMNVRNVPTDAVKNAITPLEVSDVFVLAVTGYNTIESPAVVSSAVN